jgi:hypothetical protein
MNESLSLFGEVPGQGDKPGRGDEDRAGVGAARRPRDGRGRPIVDPDLAAARRLARRMARLADGSPEQSATGQRICRHLIAMLRTAESSAPHRPPH